MNREIKLVSDVGGTNVRFAIADRDNAGYSNDINLKCADYLDMAQAASAYLKMINAPDPETISLAVAGAVSRGEVRLTNNYWHIIAEELSQAFSGAEVMMMNDFTAIAHAIPHISTDETITIGHPQPHLLSKNNFKIGIIGPGTGLGMAGLIQKNGHSIPVSSEAGHIGFAPETEQQADLLKALRKRYTRVSAERVLSGQGLENIYWALSRIQSRPITAKSAAEIFQLAENKHDSLAYEAVQLYFEILGQVAGDLALMLGAEDGIFIAGGITKRYPDLLEESRFRTAFENKGRYREYMEKIPTQLIMHPHPGLLGASAVIHTETPATGHGKTDKGANQ